jgi:hypothetical protein
VGNANASVGNRFSGCGSASGIDSSPLILSSIEEERNRMQHSEYEVFCLSLYASAFKY